MKKILPILGLLLWFLLIKSCVEDSSSNCCRVSSGASKAAANGNIAMSPNEYTNEGERAFYKWGQCDPITANDFASFRDSILNGMSEGRALQIIGMYCSEEGRGLCDEDNLGLSRANRMRDLFLGGNVAKEKVKVRSQLRELQCDNLRSITFSSIRYRYLIDNEFVKEQGDNTTLVYFPFASDERISNPQIESYLTSLAERLKEGDEGLTITGHTDSVGDPAKNKVLGQERADAIKELLISYGVPAEKIIATSMGQEDPVADNSTDTGRALNRRTELKITS